LDTSSPYTETVGQPKPAPAAPRCRDPDDQVFVDLLIATGADALVTGDGDLLAIATQSNLPILTPAQLREILSGE
jgi:predicted nucleic acid-binding protein